MSLYVASLNSGSNGNCYYVGNEKEAILIDAGISCREIEKRMKRLALSIEKVKAVFISHEHGDHIHGVAAFSKKHKIVTYITEPTYRAGNLFVAESLRKSFHDQETITLGGLEIHAFSKQHDAADPYSFTVSHQQVTVGIFTDIGHCCKRVIEHFKVCHAAFLEANYDEELLEKGSYPYALKNRIRNGHGHLSNRQAATLFKEHRAPFMTHLFLSHLSRNNNSPERALKEFEDLATRVQIEVASREQETVLFHVTGAPTGFINKNARKATLRESQLSLF